ncbi:hypothetical protein [Streptomyces sp. NPDC048442]|uniref:hypothetical protein n=1 Tax=Streptomyces sp. NPDC048442 TaxID=3154823 RepID=UPI00344AF086
MLTETANRASPQPSFWRRVREFAVPPSMIETATARRRDGDWAGACAAAGIDVDLQLRTVAHAFGQELAARVRDDLRAFAPDLLRWHMPRIAPDGLLRPGLTISLARYGAFGAGELHLVVRTPPAWADAGQRMSLALWDGSHGKDDRWRHPHPHPHPSRRFRLDLHRHLWDARRADELRFRAGSGADPEQTEVLPPGHHCAVDRWSAEARILLQAEGLTSTDAVRVRVGGRQLLLEPDREGEAAAARLSELTAERSTLVPARLPLLPDAATWVLPDLELLRTGTFEAGRLHPLVASALAPSDRSPRRPDGAPERRTGDPHLVDCRGARHRIGLVDGVLAALDHDPAEIRREELLAALTGTPLPCFQAIDEAHRNPHCLTGVRERLDHGDTAGALAVVEGLIGPDALLRNGPLRDELEAAARRRISYGLFRAGLAGSGSGSGSGAASGRISPPRTRPGRYPLPDRVPRPRHARR